MAAVESEGVEEKLLATDNGGDSEATEATTMKAKPVTDRTLLIAFVVMVAVGIANNILRVLQFGPMQPVRPCIAARRGVVVKQATSTSHYCREPHLCGIRPDHDHKPRCIRV
jgi:hypothetical protein